MIEEVGRVGAVREKRRKGRGKVVARERGRERAEEPKSRAAEGLKDRGK